MTVDCAEDPWLERGRAAFARQAFSRLLRAELTTCSREGVELRLPIRDDLRQQYGFVHGGAIAYLADNAMAFAGGACSTGCP